MKDCQALGIKTGGCLVCSGNSKEANVAGDVEGRGCSKRRWWGWGGQSMAFAGLHSDGS